jgi:hypothetical protein
VAALDDAAIESPSFVPDVAGTFMATLTANDGTDDSAGDVVSTNAEDNTTAMSVGAAGGDMSSSDGALSLNIPAGALAGDTDITVTRASEGQLPTALAGLGGPVTACGAPFGALVLVNSRLVVPVSLES